MVAPLIMAGLSFLGPLLTKALTSPVVTATAASWVAKKFGLADSTVEGISNFLNGLAPSDQIKLKELDNEFKMFMIEQGNRIELAELGLLQGQLEINKVEAASTSFFVAGWRPLCGWIGGVALGYAAILEPLMRFAATVIFSYKGTFPVIDTMLTLQVLMVMLGLAGLRTYDKKVGNGSEKGKY